jgi:hypothetical protein
MTKLKGFAIDTNSSLFGQGISDRVKQVHNIEISSPSTGARPKLKHSRLTKTEAAADSPQADTGKNVMIGKSNYILIFKRIFGGYTSQWSSLFLERVVKMSS